MAQPQQNQEPHSQQQQPAEILACVKTLTSSPLFHALCSIYTLLQYLSDRALDSYFVYTISDGRHTRRYFYLGIAFLTVPALLISAYVLQDYKKTIHFVSKNNKEQALFKEATNYRVRTVVSMLLSPIYGVIPIAAPWLMAVPEKILDLPGLGNVSNAISIRTTLTAFEFASLTFGSFPMLLLQTIIEGRLESSALSWMFVAKLATGLLSTSAAVGQSMVRTPENTSMSDTGTLFEQPQTHGHYVAVIALIATDCFATLCIFTLAAGYSYADLTSGENVSATVFFAVAGFTKLWRVGYSLHRLSLNVDWITPGTRPHSRYFHLTPFSLKGRLLRGIAIAVICFPFDFLLHYTRVYFVEENVTTLAHRATKIMANFEGAKMFGPSVLLLVAGVNFVVMGASGAEMIAPNLLVLMGVMIAGIAFQCGVLAYYYLVLEDVKRQVVQESLDRGKKKKKAIDKVIPPGETHIGDKV
jgi:hypothetical protein